MQNFCTQCGTSNTAENAFCEGCGHALNKPQAAAPLVTPTGGAAELGLAPVRPPRQPWSPRAVRLALGAVASVVVVGGVGLYFALAAPTASRSQLLELTQAAYSESTLRAKMFELCLNNMNYGGAAVNVNPSDDRTREWMDLLAKAGVYSAAEEVTTGGFFVQQRLQYTAQPELAKWRRGSSLCLAKSVAVVDVVDIQPPKETPLSGKKDAPRMYVVKANAVFQAHDIPSWLSQPEVQVAVQARLGDWKLEGGQLRSVSEQQFAYHDGAWITGADMGKAATQLRNEAEKSGRGNAREEFASPSSSGGFFSGLAKIFSFGGHPLVGTWRMDMSDTATAGLNMFTGNKIKQIEFTSDAVVIDGKSVKGRFDVQGDIVTVTLADESEFEVKLLGKDAIELDMGMMSMKYKRHQ